MTDAVASAEIPRPYPVAFDVEPQLIGRNRLTVLFRIILAIPHLILVGGPIFGIATASFWYRNNGDGLRFGNGLSSGGLLGVVAFVISVIAWFAILFTSDHPRGLWDFSRFYMRWRTKAVSYLVLFRDEYPPFGDGSYPVTYEVEYPQEPRDKWAVGLRIIYAIPHAIVLFFLGIAWFVTTVIAWFAILFTGVYPAGLYRFGVGVMRWAVRYESYLLLLRDEYPPFRLEA